MQHLGDEESRETVKKSGDRGTGRLHECGGDGRRTGPTLGVRGRRAILFASKLLRVER